MELDQILQLIDKVSDSSLTAFDYEADGIKIAMEHGKAAPVQVQMSGVPSGAGLQMAEMMGGANGVTAKEAAMPERKETAGKSTAVFRYLYFFLYFFLYLIECCYGIFSPTWIGLRHHYHLTVIVFPHQ